MKAPWTNADAQLAAQEGWNLFNLDEGRPEIQRDDQAGVFASDAEAIAFVHRSQAPHCRKAVALTVPARFMKADLTSVPSTWLPGMMECQREPGHGRHAITFLVPIAEFAQEGFILEANRYAVLCEAADSEIIRLDNFDGTEVSRVQALDEHCAVVPWPYPWQPMPAGWLPADVDTEDDLPHGSYWWSVFGHTPNRGRECLLDCPTEKIAVELAAQLEALCQRTLSSAPLPDERSPSTGPAKPLHH